MSHLPQRAPLRRKRSAPLPSPSGAARGILAITLMGMLAACAVQGANTADMQMPVEQEEAQYRAHAKSYYAPPGPPEDPWGPYIVEASNRFDVPQAWIRAVIQRESGGRLFHNGELVTSAPGAMGLMQLMPPNYDEIKGQQNLGDDPYDPHDNILAGTAYIRSMYDIYGSPGFLAAYNAGPGRLEDFITRNRTLPRETRNYVAAIGRQIAGISPNARSAADLMVASHESPSNQAYASAAPPPAETNAVRSAWARREAAESNDQQPEQVAEAPADTATADATPPNYTRTLTPVSHNADPAQSVSAAWAARMHNAPAAAPQGTAMAAAQPDDAPDAAPVETAAATPAAPAARGHAFHLINAAEAEPAPLLTRASRNAASGSAKGAASGGTRMPANDPVSSGNNGWAIQVGAFASSSQAAQAATHARMQASGVASRAHQQVASVQLGRSKLFRARLTGLSHADAVAACRKLDAGSSNCVVVSPDAAL